MGQRQKRQNLEQLYIRNRGHIYDAALNNPKLLAPDADFIVGNLAKHLSGYEGKLSDEALTKWASKIVTDAAKFFVALKDPSSSKAEYRRRVLAGIWPILQTALDLSDYDRPSQTARMIADDVWFWAFENIDDLLTPGTAKIGTRLQAKARWTARAWKTSRLRERDRFVDIDAVCIGTHSPDFAPGGPYADFPAFIEPEIADEDRFDKESIIRTGRALKPKAKREPEEQLPCVDLGRMLCPVGPCGLQSVAEVSDGTSRLACGHVRSAQI